MIIAISNLIGQPITTVAPSPGPAVGDGILLEDGSFFLILESGDFFLLES